MVEKVFTENCLQRCKTTRPLALFRIYKLQEKSISLKIHDEMFK